MPCAAGSALRAPLTALFSTLRCTTDTNIGTDDRSQFDLFEAMPGGLPGVRAAVNELHAAGVKVLIPCEEASLVAVFAASTG